MTVKPSASQRARIQAISYYLPGAELSNEKLSAEFPEWSVEKIGTKTGISTRHIAGADEFTSDLAARAAETLFQEHSIDPQIVDYIILCTQSPDFYLPTTACIVQSKLGLRTDVGALDVNLGCSGYIYSLSLAKALVESGQATNVLLITADTFSKFLNRADKSVRTIFGDGAAASLISADGESTSLHGFVYGTDGSGGKHLLVPNGGLASGTDLSPNSDVGSRGLSSNGYDLYMDGPEVFNFTLRVVPECIERSLTRAGLEAADIDAFVFHQANRFMLNTLRKKLGIEPERFVIQMEECGNTVSSSIPIALAEGIKSGDIKKGMKLMLVGFGVGLSWGAVVVDW